MVKIYTDPRKLGGEYIESNDAWFGVHEPWRTVLEESLPYISEIDGVTTIYDTDTGLVCARYGPARVNELSTGAKTIINLLYLMRSSVAAILSLNECGDNALAVVFSILDGYDGPVRCVLSRGLFEYYGECEFIINDSVYAKKGNFGGKLTACLGDKSG
jgi:hypothetical protein